jgi:hypothetical protein
VVRSHVGEPIDQFHLGVAQMAAHVIWDHEVAGSRPAAETNKRALGRGRSSMAEPWNVNPLMPVRLRPVTPKRMRTSRVANSSGRVPGSYPGVSGFEPLATHQQQSPPRGGNGRRTGLRNRSPQGMSVRLGPRGPINLFNRP